MWSLRVTPAMQGYFGRTVPPFAFGVLSIDSYEHSEIGPIRKRCGDGRFVRLESIGGDLKALRSSRRANALDELVCGGLVAPAKGEVQNQLAIPLNGNEAVGVPDAVVVSFPRPFVRFFLLDETPNFIALNWNLLEIHNRKRHTWLGRSVRLRLCGFWPRWRLAPLPGCNCNADGGEGIRTPGRWYQHRRA